MRGNNQWENRHSTGQPGGRGRDRGRGRGTHPITPPAIVANQGHFNGPSFSPESYANPVNNTPDGFFHGTPQGALLDAPHPRYPPGNHHHHHHPHPHTQSLSPPLIRGHPAFNVGESYNMQASRAFPLNVTQATQEGIGGPMAAAHSIRQPALSPQPQAGSIDAYPIQRRNGLPCPVSDCASSLGRSQDQRRHLLTHLPHWLHCPAPGCCWRGDRLHGFMRHWGNDHPSRIRVPNDQCRTYDPQPLMKEISEGTLRIQAAQMRAISMVKKRAIVLQKPELFENPWGSKWKKLRNSDPHQMVPTS